MIESVTGDFFGKTFFEGFKWGAIFYGYIILSVAALELFTNRKGVYTYLADLFLKWKRRKAETPES